MEESKLVLDTHVWVSIFHKGREEDLVNAIPEKGLTLICCDEQLKEFHHIATTKEQVTKMLPSKPEDYVPFFHLIAQFADTQKRFSLLADYKDNYLVDLAWQTDSILVSDDSGFAILKKLKQPKVRLSQKRNSMLCLDGRVLILLPLSQSPGFGTA
jgi:putative PIN family toxin of toxin-antitoxin system